MIDILVVTCRVLSLVPDMLSSSNDWPEWITFGNWAFYKTRKVIFDIQGRCSDDTGKQFLRYAQLPHEPIPANECHELAITDLYLAKEFWAGGKRYNYRPPNEDGIVFLGDGKRQYQIQVMNRFELSVRSFALAFEGEICQLSDEDLDYWSNHPNQNNG